MGTLYNPRSRTTNCGFCSIAYGLSKQGMATDADTLYDETMARLGLTRRGEKDPIPRQLIFPDPLIDGIPLRVEYQALAHAGLNASSYTMDSVASACKLRFRLNSADVALHQQFFAFCGADRAGKRTLDDFVQFRLNWLGDRGMNPRPEAVKRHVLEQLGGHSIAGSKTVNHYLNLHVDASGELRAYDAQDGRDYDAKGLYSRLRSLDLFMQLR